MTLRAYGQYCGFARALETVGERWALLIIRDLLVGPKRFTDLRLGLAGIPTNVLTARLKELEAGGVIRRRLLPRPTGSIIYELTPYGSELEDIVVRLGRWGAKSMGDPRSGETITPDSMVSAMRSTFRPEKARGIRVSYEFHFGEIIIHAKVNGPKVDVAAGALPSADLIVETGPAIKGLLTGELAPEVAIERGLVKITGNPAHLMKFAEMFRIDPMPEAG
ncbi:MAG TPA: winged helix-turn-helix transcriptional regulator [Candidatus Eremiobacteraceae bacterium]|nr:winged helix-turn-helix transcriptional regulator [Candidatus Eremiobacteraceae bacterium]